MFCQLAHIISEHLAPADALAMRLACPAWREVYGARVTALRYHPDAPVKLEHVLSRVFTKAASLSISLGGFTALPAPAAILRHLKKLDLSGNRLPPAELAQLSALEGLTELNLSGCGGLHQAPRALASLTRLRKLNLSCNMLSALGSMETLRASLESLNLAHNR